MAKKTSDLPKKCSWPKLISMTSYSVIGSWIKPAFPDAQSNEHHASSIVFFVPRIISYALPGILQPEQAIVLFELVKKLTMHLSQQKI